MHSVNLVSNAATFNAWLNATNELCNLVSNSIVTVVANTIGETSTGNGFINGTLAATVIAASTLQGGNVQSLANLSIGSNVVALSNVFIIDLSNKRVGILTGTPDANLTVNGTANIIGNVYVGGTLTTAGNLAFGNTILKNLAVNGSISVNTLISVGNSTVNVTINSTAFSGTVNNALLLNGQNAAYYTNASNFTGTFSGTITNALELNGLNATNYITVSGNYTLSGNNTFGGTNTSFTSNVFAARITVGANVFLVPDSLTIGNSTVNTFVNSSIFTVGSLTANASALQVGNSTVNVQVNSSTISLLGITVNSSLYQGTANNALFLGGIAAASYLQSGGTVNSANFIGTIPASNVVTTVGNFILAGNLTFSAAQSIFNSNVVFNANVVVNTTASMVLPVGSTGQRPSGSNGMVRYNSTLGMTEFYANGIWGASAVGGATMQLSGGPANGTYFFSAYAPCSMTILGGMAYSVLPVGNVGTSCANVIIQVAGANVGGLTNVIANGTSNVFVAATSNQAVSQGQLITALVNNCVLTNGSIIVVLTVQ